MNKADAELVVAVACYATGVSLNEWDHQEKHEYWQLCIPTRRAVIYLRRNKYKQSFPQIADSLGMTASGACTSYTQFAKKHEDIICAVERAWLRATEAAA